MVDLAVLPTDPVAEVGSPAATHHPATVRNPEAAVNPLEGTRGPIRQDGGELLLATWLSPAFPIGAFAYSHGLESAILDHTIDNGSRLRDWVDLLLAHGSGWSDAVLLAEAWRAARQQDEPRLAEIAELAFALAPSAERQVETMNLGSAFLKAVRAGWPDRVPIWPAGSGAIDVAYPVAVAVSAAAFDLGLKTTLAHFLNAFTTNLVSVAVRLVPLGQSEGLAALGELQPAILTTAERAAASSLDDLGSAAFLSDIASMRHETMYSRVFRS